MSDDEQPPLPNFYDDDPSYVPSNMMRGCPYCKSDETFLVAWHGRIRCMSCEARYDADAKLLIERPKPVDDTPFWRKTGYSGIIPMRRLGQEARQRVRGPSGLFR